MSVTRPFCSPVAAETSETRPVISMIWIGSVVFSVSLDGAQAGTASPGTGSATLTLDDVANTLTVDLVYSDLLAATTNAHIHCCAAPGFNAGIIIPFVPPFVTGTTSGSMNTVFNLTPVQVQDIYSGLSYINIHTSAFPPGEIRGQIPAMVPEPATLGLIGAALVGLAVLRRRNTATS